MHFRSILLTIQDDESGDNENVNYVDVHQHPRTGFSCVGKKSGEYYADLNTNCQLYYVCLPNAQLQLSATSFACPNTTRFNQATRVCSPSDQVYCKIAERYYENVHGSIDSKDQISNEYLPESFDRTPWQLNRKPGKSLIVPILEKEPEYKVQTERPRPSPRTLPKIENNPIPKSESPLHNSFSLTFNNPQNARVVARTRASTSTSNTRRGNALDLLPAINNQASSNRFKPSSINQNSRSRLPVYTQTGRVNPLIQISTIATTSTTTTTTTTAAPSIQPDLSPKDPKSNTDYIYDYIYEDTAQPSTANNNKPISLPSLPSLDDVPPNRNTNAVSTTNANLGSLFSSAISQPSSQPVVQLPPKISQPPSSSQSAIQRAPQRNQLPQPNTLNYFNSNPFASNPFSNNHHNPLLIRQKRESEEPKKVIKQYDESEFSCIDKLPGIGYADLKSKCKMFTICLSLSKGKLTNRPIQLFCESGTGYNQYTATCEPLDKFDCKRSKDFYLYNKQINLDSYLKNRFRIAKQLADIKN